MTPSMRPKFICARDSRVAAYLSSYLLCRIASLRRSCEHANKVTFTNATNDALFHVMSSPTLSTSETTAHCSFALSVRRCQSPPPSLIQLGMRAPPPLGLLAS
jgi:hypothetical protein